MDGPSRVLVKNLVHIYEKKTKKHRDSSSTDHGQRIHLKFNEVISSMGLIEDIVSIMHRENKISDQERSNIDQYQSIPVRAKEELLSLVMEKPRDVYDAFLDALSNTNQQHVVQILVSEIEIAEKETTAHAGLIVRLYNWLSDNLNTDNSCIVALYRNDVLTKREREQLDSERNQRRRNQLLLAIISRKNEDEFQRFLSGLEETNQFKVISRIKGVDTTDGDVAQDNGQSGSLSGVRPKPQPLTRTVPKPLSVGQKPSPLTVKPSIVSPKPLRPMSPAAAAPQRPTAAETRASGAEEPRTPSPASSILSPTRRSLPNLERQLSNPASPVFTEISLKVASLRQSCTDVEDEIKKKKREESVQNSRDLQGDIKVKEIAKLTAKSAEQNSERTRTVSRQSLSIGGDGVKTGSAIVVTGSASSEPSKRDELLDQLRSSRKDNEDLRTQLTSANSQRKLVEEELQKVRVEKDGKLENYEGHLRELREQLEEKVLQVKELEKCKTELNRTRVDLTKEKEMNCEREKLLVESKARLEEIQEKNKELERRLQELQNESKTTQIESQESVKKSRNEQEELLNRSRERIRDLEKQLEEKEKLEKESVSSLQNRLEEMKRQSGEKISNLEMQLETNERKTREKISELEKKLQDSERNLNQVIEEENRRRSMKSDYEKIISGLEASLTSAQEKISDLTKQLGEKTTQMSRAEDESSELSRLQSQLDRERELSRERESLLVGSLEKNAEILRQMGLTSERLREEEKRSKILEQVQMKLAEEQKVKTKQQEDLQEAFDSVKARLVEAEHRLQDNDKMKQELDKLLSDINDEKSHRVSLELTVKEAYDKISVLKYEIETRDKLLNEKSYENETLDDLMSQLNEEKLLRIEVDKRLYDVDEEMGLLKQRSAEQEKLLNKTRKEKEALSQRILELTGDVQEKLTMEKLLSEANEEKEFRRKQCEQQDRLLQRMREENEELIRRIQELQNEAELKSDLEQRLQEAEREFCRLKQHADKQELVLQEAYEERNALTEKLVEWKSEIQNRNELAELLKKANDEISSLRKQNDGLTKKLEQQSRESEEFGDIVMQLQQAKQQNIELRNKLQNTEEKLSEVSIQMQENRNRAKDFEDQEIEINQLLQDINNEKRLRFEQQQKLDDARGTIAILNQRLESAEIELRSRNEYSKTSDSNAASNESQLAALTQKLQELSKELKEKETELWKAKKELAKERLLRKDVGRSLAGVGEREQNWNKSLAELESRITDGREISTGSTGTSRNSDTSIGGDELRVANSGPPLNLRLLADRPKRQKNHMVKTRAGLLAQETPLANGGLDDPSHPRPATTTNSGFDGTSGARTRPDSPDPHESFI